MSRAIGVRTESGLSLLLAFGRRRKGTSEPSLVVTDKCAPHPNASPQNSTCCEFSLCSCAFFVLQVDAGADGVEL